MSLNCVDVSNYTGPLSADTLGRWRDLGVRLVLVQAIHDPPPGKPPACDNQQAHAVLDAGLALGAYVEHFTGSDVAYRRAAHFAAYGLPIERWWATIEDTTPADKAQREQECPDLLAYLDSLGGKRPAGSYVGPWFKDFLPTGSQVFAGRAQWVAAYDGVDTPDAPSVCGGDVTIHQYVGTTSLAGQGGVDLDAALESEWLMDAPEPDYATALASVTAADGEIVPVLRRIAATPRLLLKARAELGAVADRLLAVHDEFLGP